MTQTEMLSVMIFGAALSVAGLVLLFRGGRSEGRNVLKAFGTEFELSSSAIIVFLVGAGIFVIPLFVEKRFPALGTGSTSSGSSTSATRTPAAEAKPGNNAQAAERVLEAEPNEDEASATIVPVNATVQGRITGEDTDLFRFRTSPGAQREVSFKLDIENSDARFYFRVFNPRGGKELNEEWGARASFEAKFYAFPDTEYLVEMKTWFGSTAYSLTISEN